MRPLSLALLLATAVLAAPAFAAPGPKLSWDRCAADGRVANRTFACDTDAGSENLVFSFDPAEARTYRLGVEGTIHVQSSSGSLPSWWLLSGAGACRIGTLSLQTTPGTPPVSCIDAYQGQFAGGIGAYVADGIGPGSWLIKVAVASAPGILWDITPGNEYFAFRLALSHSKTVSGCGGCDVPVCLAFGKVKITGASGDDDLTMYAGGTGPGGGASTVTWQGAYVNGYTSIFERTADFAQILCLHDDSSPARASTWGAVKALYR